MTDQRPGPDSHPTPGTPTNQPAPSARPAATTAPPSTSSASVSIPQPPAGASTPLDGGGDAGDQSAAIPEAARRPASPHDGTVLLAIIPHPDDESYSMGGALALAAQAGWRVHILCATRGDAGRSADPALTTPEAVAAVRGQELAESCRVLGAESPRFLAFRDGGLAEVDLAEAVGEIVRVIRQVRPRVVITLGPDGVYGHPDHIALHKLVTPAFRSAGGGTRFPDDVFGPSHAPQRLLWTAFPRGLFRLQWEKLLTTRLAAAVRQVNPERLGIELGAHDAAIDIRAVRQQKLDAVACHRTQLVDGDPHTLFPPGTLAALLDTEYYQLGDGAPLPAAAVSIVAGLHTG